MKKIQLLIALISIGISAVAQSDKTNYRISGDIENLADGWIYKMSDDRSSLDSTKVNSGRFTFTGHVSAPERAFLQIKGGRDMVTFFLDKDAEIKIKGMAKQFENADVTGGKTQAENNVLLARTKQIRGQLDELNQLYEESELKGITPDKSLDHKYDSLFNQMKAINKAFIREYPSSFVSLFKIKEMMYSLMPEEMGELYDGLATSVKSSIAGKETGKLIAIKKNADVGQMALEFSLADTLGKKISLASFKGKYVLLDFWASWCGPCRAENPHVLKAYNTFKDKGFTVFAVSRDNNRKAWLKAIHEDKLPWTQVIDSDGDKAVANLYGVTGIPASYLIDPTGKIVAVNLRGDGLISALQELIK